MKKGIALLLSFIVALSLVGCDKTPPVKNINLTEKHDNIQLKELFTPTKIKENEKSSLLSYDGEHAVFTISRDIKEQKNVGLASETSQLIVYDVHGEDTVMFYPVNLTEGVVNSAYFYNEMLYYTVFYPFTGQRAVYLHNGLTVTELFSRQGEAVGMGESPVYLELIENNLFFVHKYNDETSYNKDYYLIDGDTYKRFGIGFSAGEPFEQKVVKLESDKPLKDIELKTEFECDFWIMNRKDNTTEFTLYQRDEEEVDTIPGPTYPYHDGDSYAMLEDAVICVTAYFGSRRYRTLKIDIADENASGELGNFTFEGLFTDGEDFGIICCSGSDGYDIVIMEIDDTNVTLTKADTGMDISDIAVSDDSALFMMKNEQGENGLYLLRNY